MKIATLLFLFLVIAVAEVATTGAVFNYLGMRGLVGIYVITTTVGVLVLLTQTGWMKKLYSYMRGEEFTKNADDKGQLKNNIRVTLQLIIYYLAWVSVIIPGLVSDLFGYMLIMVFFYRKKLTGKLFS